MLFPDMPRRFNQRRPDHERVERVQLQAPLQGSEVPKDEERIRIEQWFESRGMGLGPAAGVALDRRSRSEPIDWWGKDALEFYALCVIMVCWIAYWAGAHYGWWAGPF